MTVVYTPGVAQYSAAIEFVNSSEHIRKEFEDWHLVNRRCYRCGNHSNVLRKAMFAGREHLCCPDCIGDLYEGHRGE